MSKKKYPILATAVLSLTFLMTGTASAAQSGKAGDPLQQALAGKFKGQTVNIFGPFTGTDATNFQKSIKGFETKTGITINYVGSNDFTDAINIRVQGGNPPDIADFAQPGLVAKFVKEGKIVNVNKWMPKSYLVKQYGPAWVRLSQMAGPNGKDITAGVFQRVNAKSLVFYNTQNFKSLGLTVPKTWAQLMALSNKIVKNGYTPWTLGEGAGAATGWYGTDWVEAIMMRTTSLSNYDKWISGKVKFTSPEVEKALRYVDMIWKNNKFVDGGTKAIASTQVQDMAPTLFTNPPGAFMEMNGNFATANIPTNVTTSQYSFFVLPSIDAKYGTPLEVGGDIMAVMKDRPVVEAVEEYLSTGQSLEGWVKAGGCIAPQTDASLSWYPDSISRKVAETIRTAKSLDFDASDSMPPAVGTGSFWKAMTDYVTTNKTDKQILQEAQSGWNN